VALPIPDLVIVGDVLSASVGDAVQGVVDAAVGHIALEQVVGDEVAGMGRKALQQQRQSRESDEACVTHVFEFTWFLSGSPEVCPEVSRRGLRPAKATRQERPSILSLIDITTEAFLAAQ